MRCSVHLLKKLNSMLNTIKIKIYLRVPRVPVPPADSVRSFEKTSLSRLLATLPT
jgi:hypothetical protein